MSSTGPWALALACLIVLMVGSPTVSRQDPIQGVMLEARAWTEIRDTIPVGLVYGSEVLATVEPGDVVYLLEAKEIKTYIRTDQWLRVRVSSSGVTGWAFNRTVGGSPNFEVAQSRG